MLYTSGSINLLVISAPYLGLNDIISCISILNFQVGKLECHRGECCYSTFNSITLLDATL